jgi:PAS domain S-box-containing protein
MASSRASVEEEDESVGMAARIRAFDWSSTSLGPPRDWPGELRTVLNIAEHSAFAIAVYWGPELRLLYNDAWAQVPAERHPQCLGQPAREVWADIWHVVGPQFDEVIRTGNGFSATEQMLPMVRGGAVQETYWNYSFTPILGQSGEVLGILNQGTEITRQVVSERRLSFQVQVADRLRSLGQAGEVKSAAAAMLGEYLGADRVGFVEVDEERGGYTVSTDWRSQADVPTLAGRSGRLSELPPSAITYLKAGEVLALDDVENLSAQASAEDADLGIRLGVRAVITVPLVREGRLRAMMFVHQIEPRGWKRSEAAMARDTAERSWAAVERAESEEKLRESEDHYRHTVELDPQVTWTATPDGQLNRVSQRWMTWTGTTGLGDTWAGGLHPDDAPMTFEVWGRSVETGEPYDIEHRVKMLDGSYRWARSRAFPRYNSEGAICLWYGSTEDIHEQKLAEERQRLLINELNHRVKNTLATVQAIAFQTLKGDIPLAEARGRFEARLLALSRAHNLLTERNWEGTSLQRVVADSTAYLDEGRGQFKVSGEPVFLAPRAALALALAVHELGTNALKYGALSKESGHVRISWEKLGDQLKLEWKEQDGPAVAVPKRRGFGSRLIERGLESDLGGRAEMLFEPDGLRCRITAAMNTIGQQEILLV